MTGAWEPKAGRKWLPEEEQIIERLWNQGFASAAISEQMGGSRIPSVILAHLRVMEKRGTVFKFPLDAHAGSDVISRRFKALRMARVDGWEPPPSPVIGNVLPTKLEDLPLKCCKFPVDDPRSGTYFCAEPVVCGDTDAIPPYCAVHHAVAFREPTTTRIRPRFP